MLEARKDESSFLRTEDKVMRPDIAMCYLMLMELLDCSYEVMAEIMVL